MSVAKWVDPDFTTQLPSAYKAALDGCHKVAKRFADLFACHERVTPDMRVTVDAGHLWNGVALTEVATQDTGPITAPVGNPRIDRIVIDGITGAASVVTGTPAATPAAPAIPAGKLPLAQVLLQTSSTAITNAMITDERVIGAGGGGAIAVVTEVTSNTTLTAAALGQTIYISDKADVTLPALASIPVGGMIEFVSGTAKRQRIYAPGGESLEGVVAGFYRLPSFESCVIRKVTGSLWRIVRRPERGVGETLEWAGGAGNVAEIFGPGYVEISAHNQTLSRVNYENLFDVLGTTWGAGDGSTTFGLPPEPGRSSVGVGTASGLTTRLIGNTGGEEAHQLTSGENGPHTHSDAGHAHFYNEPAAVGVLASGAVVSVPQPSGSTTGTGYANISSSGSGTAHNTMHPYLAKRRLIKI